MDLKEVLSDKAIKSKQKVLNISHLLIEKKLGVDELVSVAEKEKESSRADCIEALELATKEKPSLMKEKAFRFITSQLKAGSARIKWESARVIANTARLFPAHLDEAIVNLLENTEHEGTVVRWSTATALAAIANLKTKHNEALLPVLENLGSYETKNSIAKIYRAAIKEAGKISGK